MMRCPDALIARSHLRTDIPIVAQVYGLEGDRYKAARVSVSATVSETVSVGQKLFN